MSTQAKRLRKVLHQIVKATEGSLDDHAQLAWKIATEALTGQPEDDVSKLTELERARDAVVEAAMAFIDYVGPKEEPWPHPDGSYLSKLRYAVLAARAAQGRTA